MPHITGVPDDADRHPSECQNFILNQCGWSQQFTFQWIGLVTSVSNVQKHTDQWLCLKPFEVIKKGKDKGVCMWSETSLFQVMEMLNKIFWWILNFQKVGI